MQVCVIKVKSWEGVFVPMNKERNEHWCLVSGWGLAPRSWALCVCVCVVASVAVEPPHWYIKTQRCFLLAQWTTEGDSLGNWLTEWGVKTWRVHMVLAVLLGHAWICLQIVQLGKEPLSFALLSRFTLYSSPCFVLWLMFTHARSRLRSRSRSA